MPQRDPVVLAPDQFQFAPSRWIKGDRFFFNIGSTLYVFVVESDDDGQGLRVTAKDMQGYKKRQEMVDYFERVKAREAEPTPDPNSNVFWDAVVAVSKP